MKKLGNLDEQRALEFYFCRKDNHLSLQEATSQDDRGRVPVRIDERPSFVYSLMY